MSVKFSMKSILRPRAGLRFEILLNMGLVLSVAIALVGVSVYTITARSLVDIETRKSREVMVVIQASLARFLPLGGRSQGGRKMVDLQAMVSEIADATGLKELVLVDMKKKVIASSPPNLSLDIKGDANIQAVLSSPAGEPLIPEVKADFLGRELHELPVYAPIILRGNVVGALKATFSLQELKRKLALAQQMLLVLLVGNTVVIVVFGMVLLSRILIRPIEKLVEATEKMSTGDLDHRVDIKEDNEIGRLAGSFNEMAERIQTSQNDLKSSIEDLAGVNRTLERTQNELIYSEKLASVGRLAQGVAHEIGNPLSAVLGYLGVIEKSGNIGESEKGYLKRCDDELTRINIIIKELLDFSRPSQTELIQLDPVDAMDAALNLLRGQKKFNDIQVERNVGDNIPLVKAEKNKLMQVIINLCLNAADAMDENGKIIVNAQKSAYQAAPESDSGFTHFREVGALGTEISEGQPILELSVEDFGPGIKPDDLSAIFDPFFTTKEPGKGIGLGLAICSRIVENFGARLKVETASEKGARFTVIFPIL